MKFFLFAILISIGNLIYAQLKDDLSLSISDKMEKIRNNIPIDEEISVICNPNVFSTIKPILSPYVSDTLPAIRKQSYRYFALSALKSKNKKNRQFVVNLFVQQCFTENSGNTYSLLQYLQRFSISDYNSSSLNNLDSLIQKCSYYRGDVYKLAAYAGSPDAEILLNKKLLSVYNKSEKWDVYLALARLGNDDAINYIKNRVANFNINTDFVQVIIPDLIYTRQKSIYDIIFEWVLTDKNICVTNNPIDEREISCAYFLVEYLSTEIEDFPVKLDEYGEIDEEITPELLQKVREWYRENKIYTIKTNKY